LPMMILTIRWCKLISDGRTRSDARLGFVSFLSV
jgi:hypothetical protein